MKLVLQIQRFSNGVVVAMLVTRLVLSIVCNFVIDDWHMITDQSSIIIGISALI